MNFVKGKVSLGIVVLLVVLAFSCVFADVVDPRIKSFTLTASYNGQAITDGQTFNIKNTSNNGKVDISINPEYVDSSLKIYYTFSGHTPNDENGRGILATGAKTASFTLPTDLVAGNVYTMNMEAVINDNADSYWAKSNVVTVKFSIQESSKPEISVNLYDGSKLVPGGSTIEKEPGSKLTLKADSNVNVEFVAYIWDLDQTTKKTVSGGNATITVPNIAAGTSKRLDIQGKLVDPTGTMTDAEKYSASRTFYIKAPASVSPVNDELIVEEWMKENKDLETLAVSLRNDSDEYEKENKNMYALKEEVVYYVDYKNGGKDIKNEVKLVLELPLQFDVVDAFGGTVDKEKKTITWTFADGLEKEQSGTKVVKIKYTALSKSSKKSEVVYPVAKVYVSTSKTAKDTSAVINLIFKDEDTTISDEHYPYMIGDLGTNTFRPDEGISRAEGALVLARIFGINYSGTQILGTEFSDLSETYLEAQKAIVASSKMGLISGFPDGTYRPNEKMTKAQFMRIIASYVEVKAEEDEIKGLEIKDAESSIKVYKNPTNVYMTGSTSTTDHWAIPYVTLLARINMTPVSETHKNLGLDEEITRAEVAQLVNFYLLRAPAEEGKVQFSDVAKNHKLYADILEATMPAHSYTLTHEGTEVRVDD